MPVTFASFDPLRIQPRSLTAPYTDLMAAFNPGTSPPPVRTPMCLPAMVSSRPVVYQKPSRGSTHPTCHPERPVLRSSSEGGSEGSALVLFGLYGADPSSLRSRRRHSGFG